MLTGSGRRATGQSLLVETRRTPRTGTLDLDAAAVKTDHRGLVVVDEQQRTSNPEDLRRR